MKNKQGGIDLSDTVQDILGGVAKFLMIVGALCTLVCTALLIVLCFNVAKDSSGGTRALESVDLFGKLMTVGALSMAVGTAFLYWGEDVASGILTLIAAALYFAPLYVPAILPSSSSNTAIDKALGAIAQGGLVLGILAVSWLVVQVAVRIRTRAKIGVKADSLKFGKGVKEEADRQNVFLGRCYQLPYCRKFVRERCPIYHAKTTCWRQRTGCMCEEDVIKNAMENKPIPKDAVLAAKMIPRNHRLTPQQKFERCKSCVIYNEHQRHKYKALLPVIVIGFAGVYFGLHAALFDVLSSAVSRVNNGLHSMTLSGAGHATDTPTVFTEALLFVLMLVLLSYCLKALEFFVFKLKV